MDIIGTFGKCFRTSAGVEYGVIRAALKPHPTEIQNLDVIAEDDCGNYFVVIDKAVAFWDHETSEITVLASTQATFIAGCSEPDTTDLNSGQVNSVWTDPKFAAEFGLNKDL